MSDLSAKKGVQQLLNQLKKHDLAHVVISPGSRNAPLTLSFDATDDFQTYNIPDERSAAFYALGMADKLQKPVAVLCTSGSALLNYAPAVSEAFYRGVPLVVISADRPEEWTDQGDGQTIRQKNALENHVLGFAQLKENPTNKNELWFNSREIDTLLNKAKVEGGPVHFNFPFDEPLYETVEESGKITNDAAVIEWIKGDLKLDDSTELKLQSIWNDSPKKMIICGQLPQNPRLLKVLSELSKDSAVSVLVENTSNLMANGFVHCIDRTLNSIPSANESDFAPDLLITLGGAVVSKKIKAFLRRNTPKHHWKIGNAFPFMDTYQSLSHSIPMQPENFIQALQHWNINLHTSRFGEQWKQLDYLIEDAHFNYLENAEYADLSVFNLLLDAIPENSSLHLANSSVVRYAQLFNPIKSINYYCNRGTSGIDGSTSTAMGAALVDSNNLHTFISGDISFFYDSNAFWNHHIPANFRMFVINNGGGGIFKIIPGPSSTKAYDQHFVAKQNFSAAHICEAFDINYKKADSLADIEAQLDDFYSHQPNNRPVVMEIFTPHDLNDQVLKDYFSKIKVTPKLLS